MDSVTLRPSRREGTALHRRVTVASTELIDIEAAIAELHEALDWYAVAEGRRLTLRLHAIDGSPPVLRMISTLLGTARARNEGSKTDPSVEVVLPAAKLTEASLGLLERLDTRSPRITVVGMWSDGHAFAELESDIDSLAWRWRETHLAFRPMFLLSNAWESLAVLADQLRRLRGEESARAHFVLSRGPVIEAPWTGLCDDLAAFVDRLLEVWAEWPGLNDAVALSGGGAFREFYRAKEAWALARRGLRHEGDIDALPLRDASNTRRLALRAEVTRRLDEDPELYVRCNRSASRVVLENDWDFGFDSYECQSPLFARRGESESSADPGRSQDLSERAHG